MKPVDVIEVLLWGKRVGATTADPALGCYAFEYEPAWKRRDIELAPLTMPLSDRRRTFTFPALPKTTLSASMARSMFESLSWLRSRVARPESHFR